MFFSTHFWGFTLLWALIGSAVAFGLAKLGRFVVQEKDGGSKEVDGSLLAALFAFPAVLLVMRLVMYYGLPVFQGSFGGYWTVLTAAFVPAAIVGCVLSAGSWRAITLSILTGALLLIVPTVQYAWNAWGPNNAQKFVGLANVTVVSDEEKMPPTDPNHLVMVTQPIAFFKGQSVIGQLGSRYEVKQESYVQQAVNGHRYFIAPLTLHNWGDTWNIDNPESPGYIVVDAENQEAEAELKLGFHIKLFSDQAWGLYLQRYLYVNGFKDGFLGTPKFEVDNNWQPHWVIPYHKYAFGSIAGTRIDRAIIVNVANAAPTIETYNPNDPADRQKYAWVDRIIGYDLVKEYARDWGMYSSDFAKNNFWTVVFGFDKTGTKKPDDIELAYTVGEENVWVVPMTSTNNRDHTCLGVLVYETNRPEGKFYPGLKNFNVGSSVVDTMFQARDNLKHYPVGSCQLVSIYGELTWVAIYEAPQKMGKSFGGIGLLHAHSQNAADVIFANDKATALSRYAVQLANRTTGGDNVSRTGAKAKQITAQVKRIAPLAGTSTGTYQVRVVGDKHTFLVSRDVYGDIALVKEGDTITFTYIDTNSHEVPVNSLSCKSVDD